MVGISCEFMAISTTGFRGTRTVRIY